MRAFIAGTTVGIALCAAWACLPDLEISQPSGPLAVCGDGFIDPDAGEECDLGNLVDGGEAGLPANACIACKVACSGVDGGTFLEDPTTQHCYFQAGKTTTSAAAISDCEGWGGHVVRLVSEAEVAFVANAASFDYWVGISRTASRTWLPLETTFEPGWSPDCVGCFAQTSDGGIPEDPTEAVPNGACVVGSIEPSQPWLESQCQAPNNSSFFRDTLCEREPIGSRTRACGANACLSVAATESSKRYVVIGSPAAAGGLGANDAVLACAAVGGRLAVLGSREEREQLGKELGAYFGGTASAWIGLSDLNGTWGWDAPDAGGLSPPPWGAEEPAVITGSVGRAYVSVSATQLDSELAHAASASDAGGAEHAALCEVP